jgi:hypothetical protein
MREAPRAVKARVELGIGVRIEDLQAESFLRQHGLVEGCKLERLWAVGPRKTCVQLTCPLPSAMRLQHAYAKQRAYTHHGGPTRGFFSLLIN